MITDTHYSATGASKGQLVLSPGKSPHVVLHVPTGAGRRLRVELGVGQARAVAEVLSLILDDVDRLLPPRRERDWR
jgi:hypothetical protein